jgi:hypothetical protein
MLTVVFLDLFVEKLYAGVSLYVQDSNSECAALNAAVILSPIAAMEPTAFVWKMAASVT